MVDGGTDEKPGRAVGGNLSTSEADGSQGWPSPPLSLGVPPSPSGSGDAFLFMLRGCFPLSVQGRKEEG